jgi:hypothetical protein
MAAVVTSRDVETAVRLVLAERGYELSIVRTHGETGADIVGTKGDDIVHIEAIALKSSPPARAKDFYESFFRAVSRLTPTRSACAIALPARFGMGLHQRARAIGIAWQRIGAAFPELEIWLVDTENGSIKQTSWSSWYD